MHEQLKKKKSLFNSNFVVQAWITPDFKHQPRLEAAATWLTVNLGLLGHITNRPTLCLNKRDNSTHLHLRTDWSGDTVREIISNLPINTLVGKTWQEKKNHISD